MTPFICVESNHSVGTRKDNTEKSARNWTCIGGRAIFPRMQIVHVETLISRGPFAESAKWSAIREQIHTAVRGAEWPPGSGSFTIYPQSGKKRGEGNGVTPIKDFTIHELTGDKPRFSQLGHTPSDEWVAEYPWPVGERVRPGNMDAAYVWPDGVVCLEWETGNISSSHRSMNKMCLGLLQGSIKAGVLVVPSRKLYVYLTDRIGNVAELEPYFPLWRDTSCDEGILEVIVIEQDAESTDVPRIPKRTDGRALG